MTTNSIKHINRMKEIYLLSAISQYKHTDGDYLCDDADILLKRFNINKDDYFFLIDKLEKEDIVVYDEKYHEDDHTEFSYDGRKIEHNKLLETLGKYKGWLGYKYKIDLNSIPALASQIRKYYEEEKIMMAIYGMTEGLFTQIHNSLEETLFYYLSARDKQLFQVNGLKALANMFDLKYHDADKLLSLPNGFFDGIKTLFSELLEESAFSFWESNLPNYVKLKAINTIKKDKVERYITKQGDDFRYNGKLLDLSKKADYYKVFCSLYALLPDGGEVEYKDLISEIKVRIPKTKNMSNDDMRGFIQGNLTERGNGFMRYSKLPPTLDNQRPIIETIRGFGIRFNNKIG